MIVMTILLVYNNNINTVDKLKSYLYKKTKDALKQTLAGDKDIHRHKWIKLYTIYQISVENLFDRLNITICRLLKNVSNKHKKVYIIIKVLLYRIKLNGGTNVKGKKLF